MILEARAATAPPEDPPMLRDRAPNRPSRLRPAVQPLEARALMASDGSLNPNFGNGQGYVSVPIPSTSPSGLSIGLFESATAVQPDGKIILAGTQSSEAPNTGSSFTIARLNPDGSLDPSFATGGIFRDSRLPTRISAYATLAIQPDGKIIEVGTSFGALTPNGTPTSMAVAFRLNSDGTLDTTYGKGGLAEFAIPVAGSTTDLGIEAASLQADGKLVLGGTVSNNVVPGGSDARFAVARLNIDGTLDTSFGGTGTVLTAVTLRGMTSDQAFGLAIQPGGRIVLSGSAGYGRFTVLPVPPFPGGPVSNVVLIEDTTSAVAIAFTPSGTPDASFGDPSTPGELIVPPVPSDPSALGFASFRSVVAQPDGKLVLAVADQLTAGSALGPTTDSLLRLDAGGKLDASFGVVGRATVPSPVADQFGPLALQADGKIVVAGFIRFGAATNGTGEFTASRFNADGTPDPTFHPSNGLTFPGDDLTTSISLAIGPGGDIVLAGSSQPYPSVAGATLDHFVVADLLAATTPTPAAHQPPADFDGSGRTNLATYDAASGQFLYQPTAVGPVVAVRFGVAGPGQTIPAPGDYTGAGRTEIAAYLPSQGVYAIRPASGPDVVVPFGIPGPGQSLPAPGDYERTGRDDIAVYMPSIGAFGIRPAAGGPDVVVPFGIAGSGQSLPAPADYFGTGRDDIAVYLASIGAFAIRNPSGGPDVIVPFGLPGVGRSIPIPGDYDGSGHVELAVYMPGTGTFAYRPYNGGPDVVQAFGMAGDGSIPVPGDYTGAGHREIAVYDPNYASFAYRPGGGGADVIRAFGTVGLATSLPAGAPAGAASAEVQRLSGPASAASVAVTGGLIVPAGPAAKAASIASGRRVGRLLVAQALGGPLGMRA